MRSQGFGHPCRTVTSTAGTALPLLSTIPHPHELRLCSGCQERRRRTPRGPGAQLGTDASWGAQGVSCSSPEVDGLAMGIEQGPWCERRAGVWRWPRSCCSFCRWWLLSKTGICKPLTHSSPTEGTQLLLTKETANHGPLGRNKLNASSHLCEPIWLCKRLIFSRYAT